MYLLFAIQSVLRDFSFLWQLLVACACVCVRVDFVVLLHILILYKQNAFLNLFV